MTEKSLSPVADVNSDIAWFTVEQIQSRLNLTRSMAYKIANPEHGEIPSTRIGKRIYVSETALTSYITEKLDQPDTDLSDIEFFNVTQVKEFVFFARSTIYGLVKSGKLRAIRFGSAIMVPSQWLDSFLAQCGYAPRISHQARVASHQIE